jgi:transposase-like protein
VQKKRKNGRYTQEFKQYAVERMKAAGKIRSLAKELGVPHVRLYEWRRQLDAGWQPKTASEIFTPSDNEKFNLQQQLREVKQLLAEKILEVDFFKGALHKIEARRQKNAKAGETASTSKSGR